MRQWELKTVKCGEKKISVEELRTAQKEDEIIAPIYKIIDENLKVNKKIRKTLKKDSIVLLKQYKNLFIENGILFRITKNWKQIVLPVKFKSVIYSELHENLAHLGSERVLELARVRFYWPRMKKDIEFFIQRKCRCIIAKRPNLPDKAPLYPIESTFPFEFVSIDYMH